MQQRIAVVVSVSVTVALALVGNLATGTLQPQAAWWVPAVWAATALLALLSLWLELRRRRTPCAPAIADLAVATDRLAASVGRQCLEEQRHRCVFDPVIMPLTWHAVTDLMDHPTNIQMEPLGTAAAELDLTGKGDLFEIYRSLPSKRLVVIGPPGAGKTVLLMRLTGALVTARTGGDPVPVMVNIASWKADEVPLAVWLAEEIVRQHVDSSFELVLVSTLISAGSVLPVLDGFDEMSTGLRPAALRQLNENNDMPMVLAGRTAEFRDSVEHVDVLTAAAVVKVDELSVASVVEYLPRTARQQTGRWDEVLDALQRDGVLRSTLTSPLMVYLARTIYSDGAAPSPAELLNRARLPDVAALQRHLLTAYVPAVYRRPGGKWQAERVERWHGNIARLLVRTASYDVAWWRMRDGVSWPVRSLVLAVAATAVLFALIGSVITPAPTAFALTTFPAAFLGVFFGCRQAPRPARAAFGIKAMIFSAIKVAGWALLLTGAGTLALAFILSVVVMLTSEPGDSSGWAIGGVVVLVVMVTVTPWAVMAGALLGVLRSLGSPIDVSSGSTAVTRSLVVDRRHALLEMAVAAGGTPALLILVIGLSDWSAVIASLVTLLVIVSTTLSTAWVQWLLLGRLWLPLTGRLPWRVNAFLADAYERGVLRQSGSVYQFRHALLRDQLAGLATSASIQATTFPWLEALANGPANSGGRSI